MYTCTYVRNSSAKEMHRVKLAAVCDGRWQGSRKASFVTESCRLACSYVRTTQSLFDGCRKSIDDSFETCMYVRT